MAEGNNRLTFEASANLLALIGRELVSSDEIALIELVKNAYDAGAKHVEVGIQPPTEKEPGFIRIRDDGQGMNLADFERIFMFAGYSERPEEAKGGTRVPTGEKGIGRFATDRLGRYLTVFTKVANSPKALKVSFDWDAFRSKKKKFNEIRVPYEFTEIAELSYKESGTILVIKGLRSLWKRERLADLRHALERLLDPFHKPSNFEISLMIPGSQVLSGTIAQPRPEDPDIEVEFSVRESAKVRRKTVSGGVLQKNVSQETVQSAVDLTNLSGLTGRFLYYIKRGFRGKTKSLEAGVQLYRDGFRVEPFGSPSADWLGIATKRAKRAGHAHLVPSRLFGFVEISRLLHPGLRDTTSRQALIADEVVQALVTVLREQTEYLEDKIRTEVSEPRWRETRAKRVIELERARLHSLGIMSFGLAHEMRQPLQAIRSEADNIVKRLEALKINDREISESQAAIDENVQRMDETIALIADLARGSVEETEKFDVSELVRKECQLFARRCSALGITLDTQLPQKQEGNLSKTAVLTILLNLWKNAVDAIQEAGKEGQRRISVMLSNVPRGHILEVTDNGVGIADDIREKLFKRFTTKKTGGLGVGLYYCNLIVQAHGGEISCESEPGKGARFRVLIPDKP